MIKRDSVYLLSESTKKSRVLKSPPPCSILTHEDQILQRRKVTTPMPFVIGAVKKPLHSHKPSPNHLALSRENTKSPKPQTRITSLKVFKEKQNAGLRLRSPTSLKYSTPKAIKSSIKKKDTLNKWIKKVQFDDKPEGKHMDTELYFKKVFRNIKNSLRNTPPLYIKKEIKRSPRCTLTDLQDLI